MQLNWMKQDGQYLAEIDGDTYKVWKEGSRWFATCEGERLYNGIFSDAFFRSLRDAKARVQESVEKRRKEKALAEKAEAANREEMIAEILEISERGERMRMPEVVPCYHWRSRDGRIVGTGGAVPFFSEAQREAEGWETVQDGFSYRDRVHGTQYRNGHIATREEAESRLEDNIQRKQKEFRNALEKMDVEGVRNQYVFWLSRH